MPLSPCLKSPRKVLLESNLLDKEAGVLLALKPPLSDPLQDSLRSFVSGGSKKSSADQLHESVLTLLDDGLDLEDNNGELDTIVSTENVQEFHSSIMFEPEELNSEHVQTIQKDWQEIQQNQGNDPQRLGVKLIELMHELDPSSAAACVSTESKEELGTFLAESLEHLIMEVLEMEPSAREIEMDRVGTEWLDKDVDAKLLYKAIALCLEQLRGYQEKPGSEEAWETTFRDILNKMEYMF